MRFFERKHRAGDRGQGAVELIVALPIALFVLTAGWQVIVAGHAWWTLSETARVAARTAYVASEGRTSRFGDSEVKTATARAATDALPVQLQPGHTTAIDTAGSVAVSARVPLAGPLAAVLHHGPRITAQSGIAK